MILRVMQWNVWVKRDINDILDRMKGMPCDVYCFQEVLVTPHNHPGEIIAKELGLYTHFETTVHWNKDKTLYQVNAVLSPHPITPGRIETLHNRHRFVRFNQRRIYSEVQITKEGQDFTIGNTHLSINMPPFFWGRPQAEMKTLMKHLPENPKRYVLCGDFNLTPKAKALRPLGKKLKNCGPPSSITSWKPPYVPHYFARRLDYAFASPDLEIHSAALLSSPGSDHRPLVVEVLSE